MVAGRQGHSMLRPYFYFRGLGGKKPKARSREVRRPEGDSRMAGMEFTATEAVAISP